MATTVQVRFHELDPYGHVNHAVYLAYLEQARVEYLAAEGLDLLDLAATAGWQLLVVGLEVDYRGSAGLGDRLTVTCRPEPPRRASAILAQQIRRDEQVLVQARVRVATVDRDGRAVRLPAPVRAALTAEVAP